MTSAVPERKEIILQEIRKYWDANHISPSYRDLISLTGITSTSVLNFYLGKLEQDGAITRYPRIARGIVLVER